MTVCAVTAEREHTTLRCVPRVGSVVFMYARKADAGGGGRSNVAHVVYGNGQYALPGQTVVSTLTPAGQPPVYLRRQVFVDMAWVQAYAMRVRQPVEYVEVMAWR